MRLLHSSTDESAFLYRFDQPMQYSALFFRIKGTTDGTGVSLDDVGRIRFSIRQQNVIDVDFDVLHALNNLWFGTAEAVNFADTATAAASASILIPRGYLDDNVEFVTKEDNAIFQINFGANIASHIATGFLAELYAIEEEGFQAYNLRMFQTEESIAGATVTNTSLSYVENIAAAYLTARVLDVLNIPSASSAISRVNYRLGPRSGNMDTDAGLAMTNTKNVVETAQTKLLELTASEVSDLSAKLEDAIDISLTTTGASNPHYLLVGLQFNPNKMQETSARIANRMQAKLALKQSSDKRRTLSAIGAITRMRFGWQQKPDGRSGPGGIKMPSGFGS